MDWELEEMINLLELLGNLNPMSDCGDVWIWKLNQKGCFTSKSFYAELSNAREFSISQRHLKLRNFLQTLFLSLKCLSG